MELRSVILIESSDTIDADQRFNFMGMDSLMALSLAAALENYFRFEVPSTLA
jgi:acyl carrier protein